MNTRKRTIGPTMKIILNDDVKNFLKISAKENKLVLYDTDKPFASIAKRDKQYRKVGTTQISFSLFQKLDWVGLIRYQRETCRDIYTYVINKKLARTFDGHTITYTRTGHF